MRSGEKITPEQKIRSEYNMFMKAIAWVGMMVFRIITTIVSIIGLSFLVYDLWQRFFDWEVE